MLPSSTLANSSGAGTKYATRPKPITRLTAIITAWLATRRARCAGLYGSARNFSRAGRSPSIQCSIHSMISVYTVCGQLLPHHSRPASAVHQNSPSAQIISAPARYTKSCGQKHQANKKIRWPSRSSQMAWWPSQRSQGAPKKISWVSNTMATRQVLKRPDVSLGTQGPPVAGRRRVATVMLFSGNNEWPQGNAPILCPARHRKTRFCRAQKTRVPST